jgi:ribosomal-protein-alanine N-acetyltransferase
MNDVKLRAFTIEDAETLATLANNIKIWNNIRDYVPNPYTLADAEEFISRKLAQHPTLTFAIEFRGNLAGIMSLEPKTDVFRISSIVGYWVGEPYWGKGIATAALEQLIKYAFEELKIIRLEAGHFDYNVASGKVLEKCGFKRFAIAHKAAIKNGIILDDHIYELINPSHS